MSTLHRGTLGSVEAPDVEDPSDDDLRDSSESESGSAARPRDPKPGASAELRRSLSEVKGQAHFLLYLADQIEDSLDQLTNEPDSTHGAFLCKLLGMYSIQLENKHQGLGDRIAETCQEIYVTVREFDAG